MKLRPLAILAALCAVVALVLQAQFAPLPPAKRIAPPVEYQPRAEKKDRRAPDNTFLTFPEWYLVYSPDEYADFIVDRRPSEFPYLGHVGQLWQGYYAIHNATKNNYEFNTDYHVMIGIIAGSTTAEYGLKWGYEAIVGRVTEATRFGETTPEDDLAAEVAREYVRFLDVEPWYKFDFIKPLNRLWTETGFWSSAPLRSWERKYYLTTDFLAKAAYGWVIKQMSESSYGIESPMTAVVLDRFPEAARIDLPEIQVLETYADGSVLVHVPRYQAFTKHALALAKHDVNFLEIAGNRGAIMISVIASGDVDTTRWRTILTQPILTRPGKRRLALMMPVSELSTALRKLVDTGVVVEHVYDY